MTSPAASPRIDAPHPKPDVRHQVVIIGGGNAGISVAARLRRASKSLDIAIIEPSEKHYYQPLWTLVGGGVFDKRVTEHSELSVIPNGVTWIREEVSEICPEENGLLTASGKRIGYDFLVAAPGIQIDWDHVPGLVEALGHDGVCSNYSYDYVDKTWEFINGFTGGTAIFTHPATPVKCGGAPAEDRVPRRRRLPQERRSREEQHRLHERERRHLRRPEVRRHAHEGRRAQGHRRALPSEPRRGPGRGEEGRSSSTWTPASGRRCPYDLLHVTPPMSAPDFLKRGPLGNADGWVDVDKYTLQHVRYPNVFALGDASSLPTSKTGAAVRKQAPVLVKNLLAAIASQPLAARYDGYTACPLVTGYGKLVMAEFDYDGNPQESFPFDQSKERRSMYLFKAHALPADVLARHHEGTAVSAPAPREAAVRRRVCLALSARSSVRFGA